MPIFEYLCPTCNRIYSFLSLKPQPSSGPVCPRCGATDLTRVPSAFAISRSSKSSPEPSARPEQEGARSNADIAGMESEMMRLAEGLDERDAEDPRTMARMMRRLAEVSGERVTPTMEEMFRRMEAGEDPEHLEDELGPQLEAEMGEGETEESGGAPERDDGLYSM